MQDTGRHVVQFKYTAFVLFMGKDNFIAIFLLYSTKVIGDSFTHRYVNHGNLFLDSRDLISTFLTRSCEYLTCERNGEMP